jgi:DNA-binding response OmpR family regulator
MSKVLLVEDEVRLAEAVRDGLVAEGYAVDVAHTGEDALWFGREYTYDAVILDIMLPDLDGFAICESLRAAGVWTPVLMLSARDAPRDVVRSLDTGADDYLAKPFSFIVLLARLRALLRRAAPERPAVLLVGSLRLDPAAHRVARDGQEIELTAREFAILQFLMRNAGNVVSKSAILDNVWDFAFEGDPNIVEVYLRRLRKKLDQPFGIRTLETVRNEGYRLRTESL